MSKNITKAKTQKALTHPITPDLYQATLERLKLTSVLLDKMDVRCSREALGDSLKVNVKTRCVEQQFDTEYIVLSGFLVETTSGDAEVLRLEATFRISFDCSAPVPSGFLAVYSKLAMPMTTLPYLRELLFNVTNRMGLPPLTLPYTVFAPEPTAVDPKPDATS